MHNFSMQCTCGEVMSVEANNREEAIMKMQEKMSPGTIAVHAAEKHPDEPIPSVDQVHAMIRDTMRTE